MSDQQQFQRCSFQYGGVPELANPGQLPTGSLERAFPNQRLVLPEEGLKVDDLPIAYRLGASTLLFFHFEPGEPVPDGCRDRLTVNRTFLGALFLSEEMVRVIEDPLFNPRSYRELFAAACGVSSYDMFVEKKFGEMPILISVFSDSDDTFPLLFQELRKQALNLWILRMHTQMGEERSFLGDIPRAIESRKEDAEHIKFVQGITDIMSRAETRKPGELSL